MTETAQAKPRLLVTRKLPDAVEQRCGRDYDAVLNSDDSLFGPDQIVAKTKACDGLLVTATEKMDTALIEALPDTVKIIATYSVGYDHIDIAAAHQKALVVTNTPDVLTDATADITWLLILGAARGGGWGERMVRGDAWGVWCPTAPLGSEVTGKRLGIYGMGRIGQAVARRARGFGMSVHYHNRSRIEPAQEHDAVFHETLEDLLGQSDILSINCASTAQTRGSIDKARLELLPDGAILANSARGDIIDDDALIAALGSGRLAAAGLDVFNNEPDIDPRYRHLENAFLLPHLGSATGETRIAMGMRALDNLDAYFRGDTPGDIIG